MTKIVKFVCVTIIIISLFLAATNVESWSGHSSRNCFKDEDCNKNKCRKPTVVKCVDRICTCVPVFQPPIIYSS
uniref:Nodule-specific cysteine-rich peptide L30 n=1 Tax=Lens culinaris TaxID=3864 RepID=A0A7T8IGD8_LENCU|nr:nodule-specific cysteine-rich peptide L30 [Lens culinaris]